MIALVVPAFLVHTMASSWPEILKAVLRWLRSATLCTLFRISFSTGAVLAPTASCGAQRRADSPVVNGRLPDARACAKSLNWHEK